MAQLEEPVVVLNELDSIEKLRSLIEFYVSEHNQRLPHAAFNGETPDEMYFGTGEQVTEELAKAREEARTARMEANRGVEPCARCHGEHRADGAGIEAA